jgi:phosphoribosylformylglycinamidine cyclo-ligase
MEYLRRSVYTVLPARTPYLKNGPDPAFDTGTWTPPPVFRWLSETGGLERNEMLRTFNCGIGMALDISGQAAESDAATLTKAGETIHRIGRIGNRAKKAVEFEFGKR